MEKLFSPILTIFIAFFSLNTSAQIITTVAGSGPGSGFSGDGGPATSATIFNSGGIAVNDSGNLYIGSSGFYGASLFISQMRKVNSAGIISTFAGIDTCGFSGDGGPAIAARLYRPVGIAFDKKRNVYITDAGNRRVRKVDTNGIITTFAGNGSLTVSGDGGSATAAGLGGGAGICSDGIGNIYIAAGSRIRKVNTTGIITTFAGTVTGFSGDGGPATLAEFGGIGQIAFDNSGNLYVADVGNNRVRKINTEGIVTTIAGTGIEGYSGDGGPATSAKMYQPNGVFPDDCDNIYIADSWNNVVRIVNGSGMIKTFAGNGHGAGLGAGSGSFSGDGGQATVAELNFPDMVYVDKQGNLCIHDSYNARIRYIHMDSCKNTTATPTIFQQEDALHVFPNPSHGAFIINLPAMENEDVDVVITDMVGSKIKEFKTTTNKETEVKMNVAKGIYFVNAATQNGRWAMKIFIE